MDSSLTSGSYHGQPPPPPHYHLQHPGYHHHPQLPPPPQRSAVSEHGRGAPSSGPPSGARRRYASQHMTQVQHHHGPTMLMGRPPAGYNQPEWANDVHWRNLQPYPHHQHQHHPHSRSHSHSYSHYQKHDAYDACLAPSPPGIGCVHSRTHSREAFLPPPLPPTMGSAPSDHHSPAVRYEHLESRAPRPKNGRMSPALPGASAHHAEWAGHHKQHKRKRSEGYEQQYSPMEGPGWSHSHHQGYPSPGYPTELDIWGAPPALPVRDRDREREEDAYRHQHQQQQQVKAAKRDCVEDESKGRPPASKSQSQHRRTASFEASKARAKLPTPTQSPNRRMLLPLTSPYEPAHMLSLQRPPPGEMMMYEHQPGRFYGPCASIYEPRGKEHVAKIYERQRQLQPQPQPQPQPVAQTQHHSQPPQPNRRQRQPKVKHTPSQQQRRPSDEGPQRRDEIAEIEAIKNNKTTSDRGSLPINGFEHVMHPSDSDFEPKQGPTRAAHQQKPPILTHEYSVPPHHDNAAGGKEEVGMSGTCMEFLPSHHVATHGRIAQPLHPPPVHLHTHGEIAPTRHVLTHRVVSGGVWQWLDEFKASNPLAGSSAGSFIYETWQQPLLPTDLLSSNIGAIVEVRISGKLLGLYRETSEVQAPAGWTLGWRARQNGCKVDLQDAKTLKARQRKDYIASRVPADPFWAVRGLAERKLWGSDVYTDDSDIVAICVHSGWIEGPSRNIADLVKWNQGVNSPKHAYYSPPDIRVTLRIAPRLIGYHESYGGGLWSRNWLGRHDGVSLVVEQVQLEQSGWAAKTSLPGARGVKSGAGASVLLNRKIAALSTLDHFNVGPPCNFTKKSLADEAYKSGVSVRNLAFLLAGRTAKQSVFPLSQFRRVHPGEEDDSEVHDTRQWYRIDRWGLRGEGNPAEKASAFVVSKA